MSRNSVEAGSRERCRERVRVMHMRAATHSKCCNT